jgi:hypothetical protein
MSLIPVAPLYLGCSRSARPLNTPPKSRALPTGHVAHPVRSIAEFGILGLMKTNSASRRLGWCRRRIQDLHDLLQDLHDCRLMRVQSAGELFLQGSEFPCELGSAAKRLAHFRKGAHDKDADSRSPDRSPVSQTDNAVHPTASPHVVFICHGPARCSEHARAGAAREGGDAVRGSWQERGLRE